jgi:hypothetical protein
MELLQSFCGLRLLVWVLSFAADAYWYGLDDLLSLYALAYAYWCGSSVYYALTYAYLVWVGFA